VTQALADRFPDLPPAQLVAGLVPPPLFAAADFAGYHPDPAYASQTAARDRAAAFAQLSRVEAPRRRIGRRAPVRPVGTGLYLDGGFGVGKTHLLAALWHAAPAPKAYATFVELTSATGVLGMNAMVEALGGHVLVAIDEFELDDPGDTVLMSTLLGRLVERGVRLAATSNTQPEDLGEGRFAAADFRREIQGLAAHFDVLRIDGVDYRQRAGERAAPGRPADRVRALTGATPGATLDDFDALTAHLAALHPSRYGRLVDGVALVGLLGVRPVTDQSEALRLVVLVDRLYDRGIPIAYAGAALDGLFAPEMLHGPHRKKYQRAGSRLAELTRSPF
jgi:cell division protein ZapE